MELCLSGGMRMIDPKMDLLNEVRLQKKAAALHFLQKVYDTLSYGKRGGTGERIKERKGNNYLRL